LRDKLKLYADGNHAVVQRSAYIVGRTKNLVNRHYMVHCLLLGFIARYANACFCNNVDNCFRLYAVMLERPVYR
jgi:hypothetical protein